MTDATAPYHAKEHWVHDRSWIRMRARLAEWSWLTIEEVARNRPIRDERHGKTTQGDSLHLVYPL